ncbi:hypothetical protein OCC_03202 [Thermococcus litoralis DSM 5473]|uniref:Uncharacterized protein n=1 Tax=Thermococcus litoralis (strain ATCC 51850 / DSM 5473 / JCM 8560 / NS-C) TaxID=523849 RepID=H3ZQ62_THELN|nr:hypothetical protein [Thermococcus litoralis]EHR77856.1 hypothetical protein OCC_03202 [Thermococcus litoralis DSM 5473]
MRITLKRKAFLEEIPKVVEELVKEYGISLKHISIEEDEKGCYTIWATYESPTS